MVEIADEFINTDLNAAADAIEELVEALKKLSDDVHDLLRVFEPELRTMIGNYNFTCLKEGDKEARDILTRMGVKP